MIADPLAAKWRKLTDRARYLESEHNFKEKEYGIPWRTAFKEIIIQSIMDLEKKSLVSTRVSSAEHAFHVIRETALVIRGEIDK